MRFPRRLLKQRKSIDGDLGDVALPPGFAAAMQKGLAEGSICAVSRVAQDMSGDVTHVEWGITMQRFGDWMVGPVITPAPDVVHAIRCGVQVFTLFPTATGFACGPQFVVDDRGRLAIPEGQHPAWSISMLPCLLPPCTLN